MKAVELILLILAYTTLVISIFVSFICYNKKLETKETIAFSFSLLFLITSFTISPLLTTADVPETTNVFTLLSMVLVGLTTPLNILPERKHHIPPYVTSMLYALAGILILLILTLVSFLPNNLEYAEYAVIPFLGTSIVFSMLLIRATPPKQSVIHREKTERIFALIFLVLIPLSLTLNYLLEDHENQLRIGFTLPLVFILLSANKLLDDLKRLSLFDSSPKVAEQHFKNYQLSKRETEIASLLVKGKKYKDIAEELHISIPTVKTHVSNIYKKCEVANKAELIILLNT